MSDPKAILKRFRAAKGRKSNWEDTYEEAQEFYTPQFESFTRRNRGTDERGQGRIFDATGEASIQKFVSNIQSSLVPPMKKWINLAPGESIAAEQRDDAAQQLEKITETMFTHLGNSNFDTQVAESFFDLAIGTGALMIQKGDKNTAFKFVAVPLEELFIEEGEYGRVNSVFRKYEMPYRGVEKTWPDANIPRDMQQAFKQQPERRIKLIEATIPRKIDVVRRDGTKQTVDGYMHVVMDHKGQNVFVEREMESSPWVVFRWSVKSGEVYGRGPALQALSDVKTINKTKELILKNGSMAVAGAYTVADDGIINIRNIRIRPGALIPVSDNPGGVRGPTISALPRTGDFNVGQLILQDLRASINEIMFADPLGPIDLPVKTATEVAFRQQELAKRIGSAFGRLQFELITPLINRLLFILEDLDLVNLNDFRVDGRFIAIEHISPLAQAQDQEELVNIERLVALLGQTFGPQLALGMLNPNNLVKEIQNLLSVKTDITAPPEQIEALVASLFQQQQGAPQ